MSTVAIGHFEITDYRLGCRISGFLSPSWGAIMQPCINFLPQPLFLFAASLVVLKVEGMGLCKTDEVGEICMRASSVGSSFWGLPGLTNATFRAKPENDDESVAFPDQEFVRTGLLGFLGPVSAYRDRKKLA